MTVLAKREVWRRAPLAASAKAPELTEEERANLKRALRFLRVQAGSGAKLAALLKVSPVTVTKATDRRARGSLLLAPRAARLAGVSTDALIAGAWPPEGACPCCGRS